MLARSTHGPAGQEAAPFSEDGLAIAPTAQHFGRDAATGAHPPAAGPTPIETGPLVRVNTEALRHAGVVPYRWRKRRIEVALVTTSDGTRWIIPKGRIDPGETAPQSARREAEEEAGLRGELHAEPLGQFDTLKARGPVGVTVFLMRVTQELSRWDEDHVRHRRWLRPEAAAREVREPQLRALLLKVRRLASKG